MPTEILARLRRPFPPLYALGFAGLMLAADWLAPMPRLIPAPVHYAGIAVALLGGMAAAWAAGLFRRFETTVDPHEESSHLVIHGPYRITRNPMYLGLLLGLTGLAIWLGSLPAFVLLPLFAWLITKRFIVHEERRLAGLFGEEYRDYCCRVRRWI